MSKPAHQSGLTEVQRLHLELIRHASWNEFIGARVVDDLLAHRHLWDAVMLEQCGLAALFDVAEGEWTSDTLYVLPSGTTVDAAEQLEQLAKQWKPDEMDWVHPDQDVGRRRARRVLMLWWD